MTGCLKLTEQRMAFLSELRRAPRKAADRLDAPVIGPLIHANFFRWEDDPEASAMHRRPAGSIFSLTGPGAQRLTDWEAA
jgi:hypothetical protein